MNVPKTMTVGQVAKKSGRNRRTVLRRLLLINARVEGSLLRYGPKVGTRARFLVDTGVLLHEWPDVFPTRVASIEDVDEIMQAINDVRAELSSIRALLRDQQQSIASARCRLRKLESIGQMGTPKPDPL